MLQVSSLEADAAAACQAPAPVITFEAFQTLCTASALQVGAALVFEEGLNKSLKARLHNYQ